MKGLIILLSVISPGFMQIANDISRLKAEVKVLSSKLSDTDHNLSITDQKLSQQITQLSQQLSQKNQQLNQATLKIHQLEFLKTKILIQDGYCRIKTASCGNCFCQEDYNLAEKFYCDCRNKPKRRDCKEHYANGERINGVYLISNNVQGASTQVFCDHTTGSGGWTVIQRRVDGSTNFQRDWKSYKNGFGHLQREFWLGNENIYLLTRQALLTGSTVRFELIRRSSGRKLWAEYSTFELGNEGTKYQLKLRGYRGNVRDLMTYHNGERFSTFDQDNDSDGNRHCAQLFKGAWWFHNCQHVSLNGAFDALMNERAFDCIWWGDYDDDGRMMFSEIKVRRN
ncbi:angiopoietin-related protein 2-like [Clytia hemisphaerica]|uniref:Fibrinogen C-terminal domain-containing protein n=1 Tax=Clytia hemisphaerica TaxID=252671 RepID=A0A7M5XCT1_9CNID